ncbi:MAG: RIP metalloprotease RseP [Terriglobia bacterium]
MSVLSSMTTDIIVVAVVLGFMIFIHELGHFIAAKRLGVRVLTFSLGFGTRLLGFKRGDTDYRISLLPFGGYVKMAGEDPTESHHDDPGDFLAHPRWQRFIIALAGPTMNILTALILLAVLYKFHYEKPSYEAQPAQIGDVASGSPAAKAGLQPGDLIVRMGNVDHPNWREAQVDILMTTHASIPLEVERRGELMNLSLAPKAEGEDQTGYAGIEPCLPSVVGELEPGMPAVRAGVRPGDKIVAVDGQPTPCFQSVASAVQAHDGHPITLDLLRHGTPVQVPLQAVRRKVSGKEMWMIGVEVQMMTVRHLPLSQAIVTSWDDNVRSTVLTFEALKKIATRQLSARSLSGPVGIAQISGSAYRAGATALLSLVAFISLQLGILNLLPIPMLDGGMILMLFIESAMQRDLSLEFKERLVQAGIFLLLLVAVFVTYNDIVKALSH